MNRYVLAGSLCCMLALMAAPALGQPKTGNFYIEVGGSSTEWNQMISGGGDGWVDPGTGEGPWFFYAAEDDDPPQEDPWGGLNPQPGWLNEWWWDDPWDPNRWKIVDVSFLYGRIDPSGNGYAEIVINYTTDQWTDPTAPPLTNVGPGGEVYIGRVTVDQLEILNDEPIEWNGQYDLREFGIPYNPEWISIDVTGYNFQLANGVLIHECVPEPATLSLLVVGGALALIRRKRGA